MKNSKNKRRDFLMNVCPTVAMAFMGITVLEIQGLTTDILKTEMS